MFEAMKSIIVKEEQALGRMSKHWNLLFGHLSGKHQVPVDHSHLHLPAIFSNQVGGVLSRCHIVKFNHFLKPTHCSNSCQVILHSKNFPIIFGACWNGWNVDVTIDIGVGAVLQGKLDMQGHPYLGDGEGGAGVLLAVAGSLMGE